MPYKFAQERSDYSDLASGQVLYNLPGRPAFPIRLASEIFQRCLAKRITTGNMQRLVIYDPCCGAAYHLTTLAHLHWDSIQEIIGSDIDPTAVQLAERNLALLTAAGLDKRIAELTKLYHQYGKESHQLTLRSAHTLRRRIANLIEGHSIQTRVFQANALNVLEISRQLADSRVDIIFTDVPYGQHSQWRVSNTSNRSPLWAMLNALASCLHPTSIIAIACDKQQKILHEQYERVERFQIGKRQVVLLQLVR